MSIWTSPLPWFNFGNLVEFCFKFARRCYLFIIGGNLIMRRDQAAILRESEKLLHNQDFEKADFLIRGLLFENPDFAEALCLQAVIFTETGRQLEA